MRDIRHLSFLLLLAVACGGGDDDGQGGADAGGEAADAGDRSDAAACSDCEPATPILFVFDQDSNQIFRFEDVDGDGDMMDAGEVTVFFDNTPPLGIYNSMGMVALGPRELIAADNLAGDNNDDSNLVHLEDLNGDGDALDEGEARLWWTGALPGGGDLSFPVAVTPGPDGAIYAVQNDAFDEAPDAIYRLEDGNRDGDVDDDGEATVYFDLADEVTPQVFDLAFDDDGAAYIIDIRNPGDPNNASLDRIAPGGTGRAELLDAVDLYNLTSADQVLGMPGSSVGELAYDPVRDEILFSTVEVFPDYPRHLVAIRDADGDGAIAASEYRVVFDEESADLYPGFGSLRDFVSLPDGSVVGGDALAVRLLHLVDSNGDGDFDDAGEIRTLYHAEAAAGTDLPVVADLFTTAAYTDSATE
jgi:hypothetical protein